MFLNPWAWLGLAAVAAPILAHLLARRQARRIAYPSLRFLPPSRLTPIQRGRPTDIALLLIRCAIITAAVAALARPTWGRSRPGETGSERARAIVVDASWSMTVAAARREAERLRSTATAARIVESATPAETIVAAAGWLATQPMARELIVVSDFQTGTLDRHHLDAVPSDVGIQFVRARSAPPAAPASTTLPAVVLLAGVHEREAAEAARRAAQAQGAPASGRADRRVGLVFPGYESRGTLTAAAAPLREPWMFEVVLQVARDEHAHLYSTGLTWSSANPPNPELLVFTSAPAGSLASAALIAAVARAASPEPPASERVTTSISDATLRGWERAPAQNPAGGGRDSDQVASQWLWIAALLLLGLEALVRRTIRTPSNVEVVHERAA